MTTMTAEQQSAKKRCDCGCGSHDECCELECLVQPRFFCGQLLTDQDLTAMVEWVKGKAALARYRHGWGVSCGLNVRAPKSGAVVTVTPGYALDCCGRDIVICKQTPFDLTACWKRPKNNCEPAKAASKATYATGQFTTTGFSDFHVEGEVQAFDLFIRYSESQSDARNALAKGGCSSESGCEYTRVHEGYELYCRPAESDVDPRKEHADQWFTDYTTAIEFPAAAAQGNALDLLTSAVQRRPLQTFHFVHDWLGEFTGKPIPQPQYDVLSFFIVQDWRNQYLRLECTGCGPDKGVRLARIWVRKTEGDLYSVMYVHAFPPYRRPLAKDDWPAAPGEINLAPYIWQTTEEACWSMRKAGLSVTAKAFDVSQRVKLFAPRESLLAPCNRDVTLYHYRDPQSETNRIVCFG